MSDDLHDIVSLFRDYRSSFGSHASSHVALRDGELVQAVMRHRACDEQAARVLLLDAVESVGGYRETCIRRGGLRAGRLAASAEDVSRLYAVPWGAVE